MLASSLACVVTATGIYVIRRHEGWGKQNTVYFMSFAAGVLISVSFTHIIPRSFDLQARAPLFLLLGFMGLYLSNRFLNALVCHEYNSPDAATGIIPCWRSGIPSWTG
jgi:zinc transporter ZupT